LISSAVVTGCALLAKHTALCLVPTFAFLWLLAQFLEWKGRSARRDDWRSTTFQETCVHALVFASLAIAVVNLGYGLRQTVWLAGVPLPAAYVEAFRAGMHYNASGEGHGLIYLLGERSRDGFWYYYVVCLLLKVPIAALLLGLGALAMTGSRLRDHVLDETVFLLVPFGLLFFFSFFCTSQIGIRYLLPAFPFVYVAIGKLAAVEPNRLGRLYWLNLAVLVSWFVGSSLSFYPHYISYVNELVPDRRNIVRYLADSNVDWGQNQRYMEDYVSEHRDRERIFLRPTEPVAGGLVVVSVNDVAGIDPACPQRYDWLRRYEPIDQIAYSWLVYRIPAAG
jgi:hypothetical protein